MGTAHNNLWTLCGLAHFHDVCLETCAIFRTLVRNLFCLWEQRFHFAKVQQCVTTIGLLNDAGDKIAFAVCIFLKLAIAFYFTNALAHHLLKGGSSDTTKLVLAWRIIALVHPVTVVINVIGGELHVQVLWIDFHNHFISSAGTLLVSGGKCFYKHLQK